ncbi:MAG: hypothetical protein EHM23_19820 [Acidobacteria bacterium]|nr:MAG: hypothetical protein EHM23_19820 [Acidobacteriota bacterium]
MTVSGGASDKLGNRYEAFWSILALLDIVRGEAVELVLEPLQLEESRGIEFYLDRPDGHREYWSVKSQRAGVLGWSLSSLAAPDPKTGRSILGDLMGHITPDSSHKAVFASSLAAPDLVELQSFATDHDTFEERLNRSNKLASGFRSHLLPLCANNREKARMVIERLRVKVQDKESLRAQLDSTIGMLLYRPDGSPVDASAVRGHLGDLLLERIHRPVRQNDVLEELGKHGFRRREWALDKQSIDRLRELGEGYTRRVQSLLINRHTIPLISGPGIFDEKKRLTRRRILLSGVAGGGKSCALAHAVSRLQADGIPTLPVRFDEIPEGILSCSELGKRLGLPDSPVPVLAAAANGATCVLVIDQLDAVSLASGRRPELWNLFDDLRHQADTFPNVHMIVGCRAFDLEHDHRLRKLRAAEAGFAEVAVRLLSPEQLEEQLRVASVDPTAVSPDLKETLRLPLHLSMYLILRSEDRSRALSRDALYAKFWDRKRSDTNRRLGRRSEWVEVVDRLSGWLSEHQQISAPEYILDAVAEDAKAMVSEHVLEFSGRQYRFFHESFFDYAFARRFIATAGKLLDLLNSGEQHLFRRAQLRQVLSLLRDRDRARYLAELSSLLRDDGVRFHVKNHVLQFLGSVDCPFLGEWTILNRLIQNVPWLRRHVLGVVAGKAFWFDLLDRTGFFDSSFSTGDDQTRHETIWLLVRVPPCRSRRVVELLRKHRSQTVQWDQELLYVVSVGDLSDSPEMFDFFLSLVDDGTLKELTGDWWWHIIESITDEKPAGACTAIGHWLDQVIIRTGEILDREELDEAFGGVHSGATAIKEAAEKAPNEFVHEILPRIDRIIAMTATQPPGDLDFDPIWSYMVHNDAHTTPAERILSGLGIALEHIARESPVELDNELSRCTAHDSRTLSYLTLRAWSAAPERYADRIAEYLVEDPRRLKASDHPTGGPVRAIRTASPYFSKNALARLEAAIVSMKVEWEDREFRGITQLRQLEAMGRGRLGQKAQKLLAELQRKFPELRSRKADTDENEGWVGSPIPDRALSKMSDENWLQAMKKYARPERTRKLRPFSGG